MSATDNIPFAAILAGGRATRMGWDKADMPLGGVPLIRKVFQAVREVADTIFVVGGPPRLGGHGIETIPDLYPGANAMGGIATALVHAAGQGGPESWVLCVACDTPFLVPQLLQLLFARRRGADVVVPRTRQAYEPLCALYRASCLPVFERAISSGNLRIFDMYPAVRCREVTEKELRKKDPSLRSFINLNRPEDLVRVM